MPVEIDELSRMTSLRIRGARGGCPGPTTLPTPDDSRVRQARDEGPSFLRRHALGCGVVLYAAVALADTNMTLRGVGSDLQLEGNPVMRGMMRQLGAATGLAIQKAVIGVATIAIALVGEPAIQRRESWIWKIPSTPWVRSWMRSGDRSWIAFIPLYAASIGQGFAVASWAALPILF